MAGAGTKTELSSQPEPSPEPDATNPSRTEREPTRPKPDGPWSEPIPWVCGSEPDRTSPSGTERSAGLIAEVPHAVNLMMEPDDGPDPSTELQPDRACTRLWPVTRAEGGTGVIKLRARRSSVWGLWAGFRSEPDGRPSRTERPGGYQAHARRTWIGAGRRLVPDRTPSRNPAHRNDRVQRTASCTLGRSRTRGQTEVTRTCWDCRQARGNQKGRGTQSRRSCLMGQESDRFIMSRLEECALGDPVLAGDLVYNLDGRRRRS